MLNHYVNIFNYAGSYISCSFYSCRYFWFQGSCKSRMPCLKDHIFSADCRTYYYCCYHPDKVYILRGYFRQGACQRIRIFFNFIHCGLTIINQYTGPTMKIPPAMFPIVTESRFPKSPAMFRRERSMFSESFSIAAITLEYSYLQKFSKNHNIFIDIFFN